MHDADAKGKVVVIGGAGFLGSHLADALSDAGYGVLIYDRRQSRWATPPQRTLQAEITDAASLAKALDGARYVYHLAGIAEAAEGRHKPCETIETNVIGSTRIIEACIEARVERFLFASTVHVYSNRGSFYRVSKQATELIVEAYAEQSGLAYTILRYGALYGPRAQAWNSLRHFVRMALREARVHAPGTGREQRAYIHVKDAARLSVAALTGSQGNDCLAITGAQALTTQELLERVGTLLGAPLEIEFEQDDAVARCFEHAQAPCRYTPKQGRKVVPQHFIDIGQGILELIEDVHLEAGELHRSTGS